MRISFALHLIGIIFWLGGLILLPRILKLSMQGGATSAQLVPVGKRVFWGYMIPGALIALASGLYQFFAMGVGYYLKQPWFHTKLTLVVVLFVATALLARELFSGAPKGGRLMMIHGIGAAMALAIVFLTFLGRM